MPPVNEPLDPDALVAELEGLAPSAKNGAVCQTTRALEQLPAEARTIVQALIDRPDVSAVKVCNVLTRHGLVVSSANLRRHRHRSTPAGCKCPRRVGETS